MNWEGIGSERLPKETDNCGEMIYIHSVNGWWCGFPLYFHHNYAFFSGYFMWMFIHIAFQNDFVVAKMTILKSIDRWTS